jgi:hypothetical protein
MEILNRSRSVWCSQNADALFPYDIASQLVFLAHYAAVNLYSHSYAPTHGGRHYSLRSEYSLHHDMMFMVFEQVKRIPLIYLNGANANDRFPPSSTH